MGNDFLLVTIAELLDVADGDFKNCFLFLRFTLGELLRTFNCRRVIANESISNAVRTMILT